MEDGGLVTELLTSGRGNRSTFIQGSKWEKYVSHFRLTVTYYEATYPRAWCVRAHRPQVKLHLIYGGRFGHVHYVRLRRAALQGWGNVPWRRDTEKVPLKWISVVSRCNTGQALALTWGICAPLWRNRLQKRCKLRVAVSWNDGKCKCRLFECMGGPDERHQVNKVGNEARVEVSQLFHSTNVKT